MTYGAESVANRTWTICGNYAMTKPLFRRGRIALGRRNILFRFSKHNRDVGHQILHDSGYPVGRSGAEPTVPTKWSTGDKIGLAMFSHARAAAVHLVQLRLPCLSHMLP